MSINDIQKSFKVKCSDILSNSCNGSVKAPVPDFSYYSGITSKLGTLCPS